MTGDLSVRTTKRAPAFHRGRLGPNNWYEYETSSAERQSEASVSEAVGAAALPGQARSVREA